MIVTALKTVHMGFTYIKGRDNRLLSIKPLIQILMVNQLNSAILLIDYITVEESVKDSKYKLNK